jgi:ketosteroid isomerase-like protein
MSAENLELVRSIFAARERGDFSDAAWAHPEIEYVIADGPNPGTFTGLAEMSQGMRDFLGAWEDLRNVADEYRELDQERVLVVGHATGRGKRSGIELSDLSSRWANVCHLSDGRVTKIVAYFDQDRAFADLGLTPDTATPGP